MKQILIFVILCTISFSSVAFQKNDTIKYLREGHFDYALIEKQEFKMTQRPIQRGKVHIVRKTDLKGGSIPFRHASGSVRDPNLASNWHLSNNTVFSYDVITSSSHGGRRIGLTVNIVYREFESRDSIRVSQEPPQRVIENMFIASPVGAYFGALRLEVLYFDRVEEIIDSIYPYFNFDIQYSETKSLINFYMRDKDVFYIWQAPIPETSTVFADWYLGRAYAAPYYDPEFIPRTHNEFYDSLKTRHNAITDTLFFDGHFKVLEQDGEKYIINREHAIIYHMGDTKITHIGRVLVTEDYPKIQGKPLFIEDRDHNRIIFFAPVEWEDTPLPKPNVYYMEEEEMREYFRYVMD